MERIKNRFREADKAASVRHRFFLALLLACVIGTMAGCSLKQGTEDSTTNASIDEKVSTKSSTEDTSVSDFAAVAASFDVSALDLEYSKRDLDASYDDAAATHIVLSGSSASIEGSGASAEGSIVTLSDEGVYVVSGSLDDGQLVVEAPDTAKVQIVLAGVSIHHANGPALYVKEADKCFVTLAEGTRNTLTDGTEYLLEEGSDEPYATLFSRADLTLNGSGTLEVTGNYRHAICSKDDLIVTGGSYVVNAVEDALRGRDCVKINDGKFTLTAGGDGIKSNKDTDTVRGFVSIDGGSITINAGDDGIQAQTYMRVAGGTLSVKAVDDALCSGLEGLLAGGDLTLDAGDDAFHAETKLVIDEGTLNATRCYEGYEAEKIYVNGGNTHIVASDDAMNAAASEVTGSSSTSDAPASNEAAAAGGAPDNAFAEGGKGGMGMGDENCLIQINGGYTVLESDGDGVDSNGSVEVTGGVLLVNGPTSGGDGAFDYDLSATVSGGTVLMVGSTGMAQNFTSGTQPFAFTTASGQAGQNVALVDGNGKVIASLNASKQFGVVLVTSPAFTEGSSYSLVLGGTVSGTNSDGYTDGGTVSGGSTTSVTASTTATGGMGGLGMGGGGMPPGQGGDVQRGMRGPTA